MCSGETASSYEALKMVEVGRVLGFNIDVDNPVLAKVMAYG